ncbi:polar amino acid transport system ATP-binding protein [Orenia metallireducens]|jgi:polar amino acid transport system ATP-binding protein|uniref:amino acid ABC transporter ATP-binding protein n=1 Tax=Orenia metallireducens TaxID=1413210 RepID=UPI000D05777B|nr:amino acid ABC transporter ATP-binding protein [Orenia metallireducens]PRX35729.1 polar amino acid transport system ATP-binding protein [Orenia metallireducens]
MLEVKGLIKRYGHKEVLKGVNFKINQGETVAIMGPSGCGKSTTIRCLNRLTEPDDGKVIFKGLSIMELPEDRLLNWRKEVGFVFQKFNLIDRLTVLENVMLPLIKSGLKAEDLKERAILSLKKVRMEDEIDSYPNELSGGQKQRIGIARALIVEPSLMLLDEPTASLDPILVKEVLEVIEDLTRKKDKIVIIVTHEVSFALKVADIILLMNNGVVVERGTPEDIFENPISEVGRRYKELLDYY